MTAPVARQLEAGRIAGAVPRIIARIPGLGGIQTTLQRYVSTEKKAIEKAQSQLKIFSSTELQRRYNRANSTNQAAIAKELAERGDLGREKGVAKYDWGDRQIQGAMKNLRGLGMSTTALTKARPDLAIREGGQTQEQAIANAVASIKPSDMPKFDREALNNTTVMKEIFNSWKGEHFSQIARIDPVKMMKQVQDYINANRRSVEDQILENELLLNYFTNSTSRDFGWSI